MLGTRGGYIALWKDASPEPVQIYPRHICMLPPADQRALERGIPISGERELQQLLEDYLS